MKQVDDGGSGGLQRPRPGPARFKICQGHDICTHSSLLVVGCMYVRTYYNAHGIPTPYTLALIVESCLIRSRE